MDLLEVVAASDAGLLRLVQFFPRQQVKRGLANNEEQNEDGDGLDDVVGAENPQVDAVLVALRENVVLADRKSDQ